MKKQILLLLNFIKKNKFSVIFFLLVYFISLLTPYTGDDYGNYMPDINIIESLEIALKNYFSYESRIASRFLINLLVYHKWLWNLLNAGFLLLIYWCFNYVTNKNNNKYTYMLSMLLILFVPSGMFGQVYAWPTGGLTYLAPASLILFYIIYLFYHPLNRKIVIILFSILNLILPMFVDSFGVALVASNFFFLIYFIKDKSKFRKIIIYTIISIISMLIVYFSPGSANRLGTTIDFLNLSLMDKIMFNFDKIFQYTFYAVPLTILLMLIINVYVLNKIIKKNIIFKAIVISFISLVPLYTIYIGLYMYNPITDFIASTDFYWVENNVFLDSIFGHSFYIIFSLLFIYSIYYISKDRKITLQLIALILIGFSTNVVMLLSPTWGFRTAYFTNLIFLLVCLILIVKIIETGNYNRIDYKILVVTLYIIIIVYLLANFLLINRFENKRMEDIKQQYYSGNCDIRIQTAPFRLLWNYNPYTDWHVMTYKSYLKNLKIIDSNLIEIELDYSKDIYYREVKQ